MKSYKQHPGFDWIKICDEFGRFKTPVFTITPRRYFRIERVWPFYACLAHRSGGKLIVLDETSPETITRATMSVLLQRIGQPFDRFEGILQFHVGNGEMLEYLEGLKSEIDVNAFEPFKDPTFGALHVDLSHTLLRDLSVLKSKFKTDAAFKELVFEAMKELVKPENVMALTYVSEYSPAPPNYPLTHSLSF